MERTLGLSHSRQVLLQNRDWHEIIGGSLLFKHDSGEELRLSREALNVDDLGGLIKVFVGERLAKVRRG